MISTVGRVKGYIGKNSELFHPEFKEKDGEADVEAGANVSRRTERSDLQRWRGISK